MKDLYLYLLPSLEESDVTTRTFAFAMIFTTFVAYMLLFFAVCIASFFLEIFRALGDVDKFTWCVKYMKMFYFPIPIFTGLWYLLVDDTLKNDIVNGTTKTSFVALYIHVGFYLLDTTVMAVGKLLFGSRINTTLLVHHSLGLTLYSGAIYYTGKGHYLVMLGFISEMIGPFTYISWMLAKGKLTHLSIWKIVQQISVYLWYFRTMLELFIYYTLIKNWRYIWNGLPVPLLILIFFASSVACFRLTPHWTKVEAKRLYRQYSRKISFHMQQDKNKT